MIDATKLPAVIAQLKNQKPAPTPDAGSPNDKPVRQTPLADRQQTYPLQGKL